MYIFLFNEFYRVAQHVSDLACVDTFFECSTHRRGGKSSCEKFGNHMHIILDHSVVFRMKFISNFSSGAVEEHDAEADLRRS